jgi:hypothetical protein
MRRALVLASLLALTSSFAACTVPMGRSSGRIDASETTRGERRTHDVLPADLSSWTHQAAQDLAREVERLAEDENAGRRLTIIFGSIANKTNKRISTSEIEQVRDRFVQRVSQNDIFRRNAVIVAPRREREGEYAEEFGMGVDLLGRGGASGPALPNPEGSYRLAATMGVIERGGAVLTSLQFRLVNFHTGQEVWNNWYEMKRGG